MYQKYTCHQSLRWEIPKLVVRNRIDFFFPPPDCFVEFKFLHLTFVKERLFNSVAFNTLKRSRLLLTTCHSVASIFLSFTLSFSGSGAANTSRVAHTQPDSPLCGTTQSQAFIILHLTRPSAISFPPTSLLPSRFPRLSVSPAPSAPVPWAAPALSAPGLSARMAALPECILRQPAHSSMAIEARYESQIRYLTKRATQQRGAGAWEECVDSSQKGT